MSHSFYVPVPRPDLAVLFEAVGDTRLRCDDLPEPPELVDELYVHPFLVGVGGRGVEVAYADGAVQLRVMACSTRGDHDLALALVRALAKGGAAITPEDAEPMTLAAFESDYAPAWLEHSLGSGTQLVRHMVAEHGTTLEISGARRTMYIGPRLLADLEARASGRGTSVDDELLAAQAELQSVDLLEDVFPASIFEIDGGATYATWCEGCDALLPPADRYAILASDGGAFMVPSDVGPAIGGDAWRFIDERHARVAAIEGAAWADLVARARPHAIPGTERSP